MRVSIHQPQYLPWLGFIERMAQSDIFILLDNVAYSKSYFYNRNRIKTSSGWIWLSVPVLTKGSFGQLIKDTQIDNKQRWQEKHWKSIQQAYGKAPYFGEHRSFFERLYTTEWTYLAELNEAIIRYLGQQFWIRTQIIRASELQAGGVKTELLLNICKELGATVYLSGIDGAKYLEEAAFTREGIHVAYQHFRHPVYPQLWGQFLPQMSSIDLLFNSGPGSLSVLKDEHKERAELILK